MNLLDRMLLIKDENNFQLLLDENNQYVVLEKNNGIRSITKDRKHSFKYFNRLVKKQSKKRFFFF